MSDPDLQVQIVVQDVASWLASRLPVWSARTRMCAERLESKSALLVTARWAGQDVAYAVFEPQMSHLHYIETREDCRRRGVATRLWAGVRKEAVHREVTACPDSDEGQRRLSAWGFKETNGMWFWRKNR
jgi:ribosomal protein S18 acetylase RimI-like enzyme